MISAIGLPRLVMITFFFLLATSSNTARQVALNLDTESVCISLSTDMTMVNLLWSFYPGLTILSTATSVKTLDVTVSLAWESRG
jgi:hypothetical protein